MERQHRTVLVIDDDPADVEILRRYLQRIKECEAEVVEVNRPDEVDSALQDASYDIIFLDYLLGGATGLEIYQDIRAAGCDQPVIMLTGQGNEKIAVDAMKAGVADYLVKGEINPDNLQRTIHAALERAELELRVQQQQQQLERLARVDEVTGLNNRRYFMDRLNHEVLAANRYGSALSVLLMDLDHFKQINDSYGHLVGDKVLAAVALVVNESVRNTDIAGRYGGEEFCVAVTGTNQQGARNLAERIRTGVEGIEFTADDGSRFHVTCSIGISEAHPPIDDAKEMIRQADTALYQAKREGRNRVVLYTHSPDAA